MKKVERIIKHCYYCGKEIPLREKDLEHRNKNTHLFCSRSCRGKSNPIDPKYSNNGKGIKNPKKGLKMEKNPAWKGGITYLYKGGNYKDGVMIRCPEEYKSMSRKNGYVYEHRIIMAKHIGRALEKLEVVHHIDHNSRNNNIENLMLFKNNTEHKKYEANEWKNTN